MCVIDRSKTRDTPTLPAANETASLFGTRVAEPISAAVSLTASTDRTYDRKRSVLTPHPNLLQAGGRPHMGARTSKSASDLATSALLAATASTRSQHRR